MISITFDCIVDENKWLSTWRHSFISGTTLCSLTGWNPVMHDGVPETNSVQVLSPYDVTDCTYKHLLSLSMSGQRFRQCSAELEFITSHKVSL